MSDLFLDTETRWDIPFIARRCAESGYDEATLERIFWIEVFPEAIQNMLSIFGEWRALDLSEAVLIGRAKAGRMPRLRRQLSGRMVASEWHSVCTVTKWLRPLNESRRMQLPDAWARYEPVCRSMLLTSEASTHDTRAAAVQKLCANRS